MNFEKLMKHIVPFFIGRNGLARYETKSQGRRGLCLIINNKNFLNANAIRTGCEYDEEELKKLFEDLNFTVTVKNDLEWDEMKKVARQFAEEDHNEFDAFVFIIMSHGGEMDLIQGIAGGTISIGNLMLEFTSTRCPTLKDKPKLFIIQSCRGVREEAGIRGIDSNMSLDSTLSKGVCPKEADFLLAFSTPPGYSAIRRDSGSPFIQVCSIGRSGYSLFCGGISLTFGGKHKRR